MKTFVLQYLLPGILLILTAFWAGAQASPVWGMLGFLPFFVVGVILIIRGVEKLKGK